ncbi:uncharacterized protein LOC126834662 [Adelges cooleyi]|uniref:uncharacterized protein LOC126834662 n=1 Tax=Adelges cooleyi TaxID=133065 RepID=UPI00217F69D4|nr:uncharacterized protein LOC126834662 [Adelges cooleyi]
MMHSEALVWLTTGIGGPLSIVWLCWAILVLWFGRGQWRPSDPLLIALLGEAIAKQIASTAGSALSLFRPDEPALCSAVQWMWTAAHTMQAGTLASLALMAGLRRKKSTVTAGGRPLLLYHLASLSVVSACVGAASLIAQSDPCAPPADRRYAVFSLVLHAALAVVAFASAAFGCAAGRKKGPPNPLLVSSSSDLSSCMSDLSTVSSCSRGGIRHSVSDCSDRAPYRSDCALVHDLLRLPTSPANGAPLTFLNGGPRALMHQDPHHQFHLVHQDDTLRRLDESKRLIDTNAIAATGTLDSYATSTMGLPPYRYGSRYLPSTTSVSASSTNSRTCLAKRVSLVQDVRIGYVVAILFLCYFVDHIPVLMLMALEHFLPSKFTLSVEYEPVVKNFPMLAALAEACLWPVVLLLFDDQFVPRLSNLYRRRSASDMAKPPQGLHGKFRPYNGSLQEARRPPSSNCSGGGGTAGNGESTAAAHRFPITNGSLFASLDGRVPVLHNYRRGARAMSGLLVSSSPSNGQMPCSPPHFIHTQNSTQPPPLCCPAGEDEHFHHRHHNHLRFANMVVASAAAIDSMECKEDGATPADSLDEVQQRLPQNLQQLREKLYADEDEDEDASIRAVEQDVEDAGAVPAGLDSSDDGEDGNRDDVDDEDECEYATMSARSVCSATTAANDDFEYFAAAAGDRSSSKAGNRAAYQRAPTRRGRHHHHQQQQQQPQPPPPPSHHRPQKPTPLPPTPPTPRRPRPRLTAMLSVDSLVTAAAAADNVAHQSAVAAAYRHRHNQQQHQRHRGARRMRGHHGGSVPDLKRVFVTDFL